MALCKRLCNCLKLFGGESFQWEIVSHQCISMKGFIAQSCRHELDWEIALFFSSRPLAKPSPSYLTSVCVFLPRDIPKLTLTINVYTVSCVWKLYSLLGSTASVPRYMRLSQFVTVCKLWFDSYSKHPADYTQKLRNIMRSQISQTWVPPRSLNLKVNKLATCHDRHFTVLFGCVFF